MQPSLFSNEELKDATTGGPLRNKPISLCCTADYPGTGPADQKCGTCRYRQRYTSTTKQWYKCSIAYRDRIDIGNRTGRSAYGKESDIKMRWPACSYWRPLAEPYNFVPRNYPWPHNRDDWSVMCDFLEEHDLPHVKEARSLLSTNFNVLQEVVPF